MSVCLHMCDERTGNDLSQANRYGIADQTADKIISVTSTGKNNMPPFAATYSPDDMRDIAAYIIDGLAKKK